MADTMTAELATTEAPVAAPVADKPRDEGGRFAPKVEKAADAGPKDAKAAEEAVAVTKGDDARDADAYALATGTMTQAAFDAKYSGAVVVVGLDEKNVPSWEEVGKDKPADEPATEAASADTDARNESLDILRRDYGVNFTRTALSDLPTKTLIAMAAERKGRQDKITQTIERLKSGQAPGTIPQPKPTKAKGDDSPTTGGTQQRTTHTDPLDDDLDSLSDLDPNITASVKKALEASRKERDEANERLAAQTATLDKHRFHLAMARATEAHPELKDERVRKALQSAMTAKDPDMKALESGDDDDLDILIESCAERVIPKQAQPKESKPKGAPDLNTRRTAPKQMTQDDRDALTYEAIQKVGTNPTAVEAYIQRKLGQA